MTWHSKSYYQDLKQFPAKRGRDFHHFSYSHLKTRKSIYWTDGIYLPKWFHVPIIHLLLGGGLRVSTQKFGKFPNIAQRLAHWIARVVFVIF